MIIETSLMKARRNAPSVSDISSCKLFFKCNEKIGTTLTDSVNGIVYTPSSLSFPLSNAVRPSDTALQDISGAFQSFGTDPILGIICCRVVDITALRATVGDNTSTGSIGISNLTRAHAAIKGASAGFGVAEFIDAQVINNVGEDVFLAFRYTPGVSCTIDLYKKDGSLLNTETSTTAAVTASLGEVLPTSQMRMNGGDFYGFALFSVSSVPSDFILGCHEMLSYWSSGLKVLPDRARFWL